MEQTNRSPILDHLGLVAGMFAALGSGDVSDKATPQHPEMQIVTAGNAVKALVLNGLGLVNQRLDRVPQFVQNKPTARLIAPAIAPAQLHDETLGRALETLEDYDVTALYSLMAATAAPRLGLSPTFAHLDRTSFHVDGRDKSDQEPDEQVIPSTQGYSRKHRPALHHVMRDLMVEHHAGLPRWMHPLRGNSRDVTDVGPIVEGRSTDGGVPPRWVLLDSEQRQPHGQRTVNKPLRKHGDQAVQALPKLCRVALACAAEAQQALAMCAHGVAAPFVHERTVRSSPRYGQRGRPRQDAQPAQVTYHLDGALASRLATRQARVDQHRGCILATHALDDVRLPPQGLWASYQGQGYAERGFRFLKDPQFLASSFYLKKPERIMALLMVMTVCLLVYAALEYRIRTALKEQDATFPHQKGQPVQNPTARWVFHYFVGIHVLRIPGQWDSIVLNLTEVHQRLLQLLGKPYTRFYR